MIQELLSEWGNHIKERLSNPVLGPFTAFWLFWNWRLLAVFLQSRSRIEERIQYIDETYVNIWDVLLIPAAMAFGYALLVPWVSLLIQHVQDEANTRRKKNKLKHETSILRASVDRAEAQAALNKILAQDEVTRLQQEELAAMKLELEAQKQEADARITTAEAEFEKKRREYEASADKRTADAKRVKDELLTLEKKLAEERSRAKSELNKIRSDISKEEKRLDFNLRSNGINPPQVPETDLVKAIVSKRYRLFHNPGVGPERSKTVTFSSSGDIKEGANNNEHKWRIRKGCLELLQKDGEVHSRFQFLPDSAIFVHTGDVDTKSARGQFMVPEVPA